MLKALNIYEKSIKIDPKNPVAFNNLGNLYKDLGKIKDAIKNYEKSIELDAGYDSKSSNVTFKKLYL